MKFVYFNVTHGLDLFDFVVKKGAVYPSAKGSCCFVDFLQGGWIEVLLFSIEL